MPHPVNIVLRIWFILSLLSLVSCVNKATHLNDGVANGRLRVDDSTYDYGYAGLGQDISHTFILTNKGLQDITITDTSTDCGCNVSFPAGKRIPPGSPLSVAVRFKAKNYEGEQIKNIILKTNDINHPEVVLTLKGLVKNGAVIEPHGIGFGEVKKGQDHRGMFRLLNLTNQRMAIVKIESGKYIKTSSSHFRTDNGKGYTIEVTLSGNAPEGEYTDIVTLHTTLPKQPRIDVPVWATFVK